MPNGAGMASAKQFEAYTAECMEWATTARTTEERATFLQMAKTWIWAASIARGREVPLSSIARSGPIKMAALLRRAVSAPIAGN
jgi:hypothetical protein